MAGQRKGNTSEKPTFWIVAGPNGSGKSSLYGNTDIEALDQSIWIINPDLLTLRIQQVEKLSRPEANLQAVRRIEAWLDASIDAHQTVGVETVLSTEKYRRLVLAAKQRQFEFRLIFIMLASPAQNVERVRLRVSKGGHAVPEDKIRSRWTRSLAQLPWFLQQADQAALFDNSDAIPRLVGRKQQGSVVIDPTAPEALRDALGLGSGSKRE
jgi:predicted ABC-type ATPase